LMDRYVEACVAELRRAELAPATSVFFGGGTPSRLPAEGLLRILASVARERHAEVTVECNPEDVTSSRLDAYLAGGVTRMSFGVQSTARHVLAALGRRHDPELVPRAVELAHATGFERVNVDLIYGAVGETDDDWMRTLDDVLSLRPGHVSAYALTVEPGTPLAADPARHPDDDVQATRYELANAALSAAGYEWEEVSNWAMPGHTCRHNTLYWCQGDYRGIGSAAHSHTSDGDGGHRWWNVRTPDRYVASIESGRSPVAAGERVDGEARVLEGLMLSLRTPAGVPEAALPLCGGEDGDVLEGLVERRDGRAVLTVRGRLMASAVSALLRAPPASPVCEEVGLAPSGAGLSGR
ncbi:MAG: coproporphyrinogen-III oxidase family protein, partial [Acidimicrobiales bacterium]